MSTDVKRLVRDASADLRLNKAIFWSELLWILFNTEFETDRERERQGADSHHLWISKDPVGPSSFWLLSGSGSEVVQRFSLFIHLSKGITVHWIPRSLILSVKWILTFEYWLACMLSLSLLLRQYVCCVGGPWVSGYDLPLMGDWWEIDGRWTFCPVGADSAQLTHRK